MTRRDKRVLIFVVLAFATIVTLMVLLDTWVA